MRIYKTILLFIFFICVDFNSQAQTIERFNTFSYNVNEGLLQSTMGDIAFDQNNFCWLSFPNGIQKFDGKNFITVPIQPGLPDVKMAGFFRSSNGDLFISHSEGISKYEIAGNRFIQVYTSKFPGTPAIFIGEDDKIIYFYTGTGNITGIHSAAFNIVAEIKTGFPDYSSNDDYLPKFSDNIINHRVALQVNSSLSLWDLQKGKLLSRSAPVPGISKYMLKLKTECEVLYYTYRTSNSLFLYNFTTNTSSTLFVKGKDDEHIDRCIIFPLENKTLISFSNKLYETDTGLQVLKSELVNYQNHPIVEASTSIARIKEDNFGNLCITTVTNGIRKVIRNNYPVKYYGTGKKEENFVISVLPDKKNNRILAGTRSGLLVFDTMQHLIKHIKTLPGKSLPFELSTIIKAGKGNYFLFISGEKSVWQLSNDLSEMKRIPVSTSVPENKSGINYFGNFLFQNEREAITQSQSMLYKTNFIDNTISEHEITTTYTMGALLYHSVIITHANDELIFLDAATVRELKRVSFKNTGRVRCFARDAADNIYLGSNNGIFIIDSTGNILLHLKKENGLPDECIYAMVFDEEGFLWCSSNKGVFKINKNNSILQITKEDGLQENEFNTNVVAKADDGELFFGGVNGISSFYPSSISSFEEKINLLVTKIKINNEEAFKDTAVWNISAIDLPYHQNSLSFDFIAMANNNPGQYIYQYRMDEIDDEWIQNNDLQTVRYFLPPGKYVFKIYASRFFDKDAKPMKEIRIVIHPPFWKAWWFLTGLAGIFLFAMAYGINQYNKRKYRKKLADLESEYKVQLERERISRDLHDSIGAYANAVLYNTELLEKEDEEKLRVELMKDLKFASKDIITALRENIWALKKENFSAEDCLLRIRNFIQPFTRYYQHIQFKIEGEAPADRKLHYTKALNVVRIVQEAVTNAIKHAGAGNVRIASYLRNERWELTVTDDGKGFDYETIKGAEQGNGLNNMKQRAIDSDFDLIITSGPGRGTEIRILV